MPMVESTSFGETPSICAERLRGVDLGDHHPVQVETVIGA